MAEDSLLLLLLLWLAVAAGCGPTPGGVSMTPDASADVEDAGPEANFFEAQMRAGRLPGLAIAVVGREGIRWSATFGVADVHSRQPFMVDTLVGVASVSKLVVGLLLMRGVEGGEVDLDEDVRVYLSHDLRHPEHPEARVSLRDLATHTSGLRDTLRFFTAGASDGDPTGELGTFTARYVDPQGDLYRPSNFSAEPPGETYAYSNFGIALLAHALEGARGQDFRSLSSAFLESLSVDARFFLADLDAPRVSGSYGTNEEGYVSVNPSIQYYPAGSLRGSLLDMARLLRVFLNDGALDGQRLLEPSSIARMEQVASPRLNAERGIVLDSVTLEGVPMHGHGGAGAGCSADLWYGRDFGVVVLANSNAYLRNRLGDSTGRDAMHAIRAEVVRRGLALGE